MSREHLFRVRIADCEVQTFRAGGKGGQKQNKTDSGVRVIHHPSGAVGESREQRSQLQNKRAAFRRMGESVEFKNWARARALNIRPIAEIVEEMMHPDNLVIEAAPLSGGDQ